MSCGSTCFSANPEPWQPRSPLIWDPLLPCLSWGSFSALFYACGRGGEAKALAQAGPQRALIRASLKRVASAPRPRIPHASEPLRLALLRSTRPRPCRTNVGRSQRGIAASAEGDRRPEHSSASRTPGSSCPSTTARWPTRAPTRTPTGSARVVRGLTRARSGAADAADATSPGASRTS